MRIVERLTRRTRASLREHSAVLNGILWILRTGAPWADFRRYRRRWKIERLFAWFQNFRRLVVRYERFAENFLGMRHLACCVILLRGL